LRFQQDDEKERKATQEGVNTSGQASEPMDDCDNDLGYMDESLHEASLCDWKNLVMMLESRYKDMPMFRLAIRQFAIKNEFELGIKATCPFRFRGYCKGVGVHGESMQGLKYKDHQPLLYVSLIKPFLWFCNIN
jgi:hypothetical protein